MTTFDNIGIETLKDIELFSLLGLEKSDLTNATRYNLFRDVSNFFKNKQDASLWINRVTQGKNVDKLEQVWGYVKLHEKRSDLEAELRELNERVSELMLKNEDGTITSEEDAVLFDLTDKQLDIVDSIGDVSEEIGYYEN